MAVDVKATLARNGDTLATLAFFSVLMVVAALGSFFFIFSTELGGARALQSGVRSARRSLAASECRSLTRMRQADVRLQASLLRRLDCSHARP